MELIWRWRHRRVNPRRLARAQWEAEDRARQLALHDLEALEDPEVWRAEAARVLRSRRPVMPSMTKDQLCARAERQLIAEAARRG